MLHGILEGPDFDRFELTKVFKERLFFAFARRVTEHVRGVFEQTVVKDIAETTAGCVQLLYKRRSLN